MLGVHMVTSPELCPKAITPLILFYYMSVGSPLLVLASETTYPIDTSKYLKVPNLLALASKK